MRPPLILGDVTRPPARTPARTCSEGTASLPCPASRSSPLGDHLRVGIQASPPTEFRGVGVGASRNRPATATHAVRGRTRAGVGWRPRARRRGGGRDARVVLHVVWVFMLDSIRRESRAFHPRAGAASNRSRSSNSFGRPGRGDSLAPGVLERFAFPRAGNPPTPGGQTRCP